MVTLSILGFTFILSTLALVLISILVILALPIIFFLTKSYLRNRARKKCKEIAKSIIQANKIVLQASPARRIWLNTLMDEKPVISLYNLGRYVVLGTPDMGITDLLVAIANKVNSSFVEHGRCCAYINVHQIAEIGKDIGYVSADEIYRAIAWSSVETPINHLKMNMSRREFSLTGLPIAINALEKALQPGLSKVSPADVRKSLDSIWQLLGIEQVMLIVDGVTALHADTIPYFLGSLLRVYGRTINVGLIISGDPNKLNLHRTSNGGNTGVQVSHDVKIALDLREFLMPQTLPHLRDEDDIRLKFLSSLIQIETSQFAHHLNGLEYSNLIQSMFTPTSLWKKIFELNDGNIDNIARDFQEILINFSKGRKKITAQSLSRIVGRYAEPIEL